MWRIVHPVTMNWRRISLFMPPCSQLDEESGDSTLDLRELLEDDIRRSKHYILKMKFRRALSGVGFCTLIAGLGGFLIYIIMQTL